MRSLTFWGASDDLAEIRGTDYKKGEPDEVGIYDKPAIMSVKDAAGNGLVVIIQYVGFMPTWSVGIAQLDEDVALPDWPMEWRVASDCNYSVELVLEAPDDAVVELISPQEDDD